MKNRFLAIIMSLIVVLSLYSCKYNDNNKAQFDEKTSQSAIESNFVLTEPLFTGMQGKNHIQGIAVDDKNGYIYYSFTTKLVKSDFEGNIIGSVGGLYGHLGCIAFNKDDGKIYGTIEYKHDSIGNAINKESDLIINFSDGFYIGIFDVDKIVENNMTVENSDVMTAVHLSEVLNDYNGVGYNLNGEPVEHKYGCSGIDGICFAPLPGAEPDEKYLYVAYGIYNDISRSDNDHQVLLCYNVDKLNCFDQPLTLNNLHRSGPENYDYKFFVYTGNTTYGVQNMTYDTFTNSLFMAVYKGTKSNFENFNVFSVDMSKPAVELKLNDINETGLALTLSGSNKPESNEINGWYISYGQCGLSSRNDGSFYVAEQTKINDNNAAYICIYDFNYKDGFKKQPDFKLTND